MTESFTDIHREAKEFAQQLEQEWGAPVWYVMATEPPPIPKPPPKLPDLIRQLKKQPPKGTLFREESP